MTERIRLTISVTPETHAIFQRMAEAAGVSLGRAMGDWLDDTSEGAQLVALKMQEARESPMRVMREMQGMARGLVDMADSTVTDMRAGRQIARAAGELSARPAVRAPSSNTGLNPPGKSPTSRRKT